MKDGIGYFLLGDSLNTTVTVIGTLQNSIVAYNTLQLTYLLIVGIAAQVRPPSLPFPSSSSFTPSNMRDMCTGNRNIRLLVHPTPLPPQHKNHVQPHRHRHHIARWLGHDWHLDPTFRLPQRMGSMALPSLLRAICLSLVLIQPNHDLRSDPPRKGVFIFLVV